jgi:hypothetical protein
MASSFNERRASQPQISAEDSAWLLELAAAEYAVDRLLDVKRAALRDDPQHEQVLWARHVERLRVIKRKLDAVCM